MQIVDRKIFLVSIKALVLDRGRVLLVQKPNGIWDLPGGRL
jgi:8-oxo-dGTP pyrophosphatase MutT (NUDIX family)